RHARVGRRRRDRDRRRIDALRAARRRPRAPARPGLRDPGLLPAPARAGQAPGPLVPRHVPVRRQRPRPGGGGPPLAPRSAPAPARADGSWLVVPLVDRAGARLGAVFADDPTDRLLPTRERLQALRLFANHAKSALESSAQYETMRYLAYRDPLTKLLNRRAFVRHLEDAAGRARVSGRPLALLYCDLDGFKAVNDTRGHAEGDRVLCAFGRLLVATVRHDDAVFRMGSDEFALVLEECPRERALEVVDRVVERLHAERGTGELPIGASVGVAVADCSGPVDGEALLRRADDAMYDAKGSRAVLRVAALGGRRPTTKADARTAVPT